MQPLGITSSFVDLRDMAALEAAASERTRMIWLESPTNPLLRIVDIAAAADVARRRGLALVVDNTFASPALQRPLELGATVVLHSTTKYINGHSDAVGGALIMRDGELAQRVAYLQNAIGAVPSPFDCYLVLRGVKTLAVRMDRHCENARAVAAMLAEHPAVERVLYPGLPSHPQHALALRQMRSGGGRSASIWTATWRRRGASRRAALFALAESLGGSSRSPSIPRS
jgi:cystathionine beta-lyase/cystathionine gamma-synthase